MHSALFHTAYPVTLQVQLCSLDQGPEPILDTLPGTLLEKRSDSETTVFRSFYLEQRLQDFKSPQRFGLLVEVYPQWRVSETSRQVPALWLRPGAQSWF